ncbi:hypothetical protein AAZX31_03G124000 [Glycine max]|uniref:Protein POLYCHOME n=2 Tax=Glycine subgen. Soja TaxID=1462606 RepID=I1JNH4_SOYBN|nr:protein POLYCHOME [Glycine max]XP_028225351.1 protein POLYCHOME-like [Glycine soja]KAG5055170.1 hypothetical protein JHK85_007680 [Glycine max]KAG5072248.1 hypothetical protein JHK86_007459 [Glycine max]KAH1069968.1 hypothetical protein GYH30_007199 [Glycine max]KAH1258154.1 Protein POLYCHOME [Glycine max]KRH67023.1 hypothetical protein GLYMA_03G141800v4 [Glycine max]|eukprot:XP_003521198.1 protein POLYCHOME [Glycine max]
MPESRDRRITVVDLAAAIARRRASFIYIDSPPLRTPQRTAAIGRGRASGSPGSQNTPPSTARRGRGRVPSRNVLPAWYPRTPLRDITVVVQAIERRRARSGEAEGQRIGSTDPASDRLVTEPSEPASADSAVKSPKSVGVKLRTPFGSKVPKIFLDISELPEDDESETLTPQKKLLNNIDQVEEAVREELKKLKRTPSAKKAEREKRVRTLMSMR